MKIQENNGKVVTFGSLNYGDVFRHADDVVMKVFPYKVAGGTVRAISLAGGEPYTFLFGDDNIPVEPLDATLVINPKE
jgi:hypothetical protein